MHVFAQCSKENIIVYEDKIANAWEVVLSEERERESWIVEGYAKAEI